MTSVSYYDYSDFAHLSITTDDPAYVNMVYARSNYLIPLEVLTASIEDLKKAEKHLETMIGCVRALIDFRQKEEVLDE